jgi:hypothetical protein
MNTRWLVIALAALAIVGGMVGAGLFVTKDNRLQLQGKILGVRSYQIDPQTTVAIIDFQVKNPSTQQFQLKDATVHLTTADGKQLEGGVFSEIEAQRLFEYYPMLGKKYNQSLIAKTKIESGQTMDRMLAAKFEGIDEVVQKRKGLVLKLTDVDGVSSELVEQR